MKRSGIPLFLLASSIVVTPVRADDKADLLFKQVQSATQAAVTLTADLSMKQTFKGMESKSIGTIKLKKPNLARIDLTGQISGTTASDGKTLWVLSGPPDQQQYEKGDVDPKGRNVRVIWAIPVISFFDPHAALAWGLGAGAEVPPNTQLGLLEPVTVDGQKYQVIEGSAGTQILRLFVGSNKLVCGSTVEIMRDNDKLILEAWFKNIKVGGEIANSQFAFEPPKTAKLYEPPYNALLIPVGSQAPDFNLPTLKGDKIALSEASKGKKAILINFWVYT